MPIIKTEVTNLLVIENIELYRPMYSLVTINHQINLLGVYSGLELDEITKSIYVKEPDVILIATKKYDPDLVQKVKALHNSNRKCGMVLIFSFYDDSDSDNLRALVSSGNNSIAIFLRESLDQIEQVIDIIKAAAHGHVILDADLTYALFQSNHDEMPYLAARLQEGGER